MGNGVSAISLLRQARAGNSSLSIHKKTTPRTIVLYRLKSPGLRQALSDDKGKTMPKND